MTYQEAKRIHVGHMVSPKKPAPGQTVPHNVTVIGLNHNVTRKEILFALEDGRKLNHAQVNRPCLYDSRDPDRPDIRAAHDRHQPKT